jgi:uncharacterized membrane protein YgcG
MRRVAILLAAVGFLACFNPVRADPLVRGVPESKFTGVGLSDALDFIRDVSGINLNVDWKSLAEAGVTKDAPINLRMYGVSVRRVLNAVLTEAAGGDTLTFYVDDGVVEITTKTVADAKLITRVYPVGDLLVDIPDFTDAPNFDLTQQSSGSGGGKGGGGGGGGSGGSGGLFSSSSSTTTEKATVKTREEKAQELVDLIMTTVRPEIWKENGGTASIRYFNGHLVVSAPRSVHEMLGGT